MLHRAFKNYPAVKKWN